MLRRKENCVVCGSQRNTSMQRQFRWKSGGRFQSEYLPSKKLSNTFHFLPLLLFPELHKCINEVVYGPSHIGGECRRIWLLTETPLYEYYYYYYFKQLLLTASCMLSRGNWYFAQIFTDQSFLEFLLKAPQKILMVKFSATCQIFGTPVR